MGSGGRRSAHELNDSDNGPHERCRAVTRYHCSQERNNIAVLYQGGNRRSIGSGPTARMDSDARATAGGVGPHPSGQGRRAHDSKEGGSIKLIVSGGHVGRMERHQPQGPRVRTLTCLTGCTGRAAGPLHRFDWHEFGCEWWSASAEFSSPTHPPLSKMQSG